MKARVLHEARAIDLRERPGFDWIPAMSDAYRLLLLMLILAANAFFAAAEVALISARRSRLRALADEGHSGAHAALNLLANPERLLSVVQVGVTLASLGMGWAGEAAVFDVIVRLAGPLLTAATTPWIHGISFTIAFLSMSFAHVVLGEVVPKNLAIESADRLAVLVAPALLVFYRVSSPFVYVIERSAAWTSKLLGLRGTPQAGGHSAEELKFLIRSSGTEGHLLRSEESALERLLELGNYYAREIMVPRNDVVSIRADAPLEEALRLMNEHQYSRLPVWDGRPEHIVGILHFKDVVRRWLEHRGRPGAPYLVRRVMREAVVVPETKPLNQLIDEFRNRRSHIAVVVDEFGTIVGLVTLEDVLEQIFGEIEDEHDVRRPAPAVEGATLEVEGATPIRDLEMQYGITLPGDAGFQTLAGFLLYRLGHIPQAGEALDWEGRRYTILSMSGRRVAKVRIERLARATEEPVQEPRAGGRGAGTVQ